MTPCLVLSQPGSELGRLTKSAISIIITDQKYIFSKIKLYKKNVREKGALTQGELLNLKKKKKNWDFSAIKSKDHFF